MCEWNINEHQTINLKCHISFIRWLEATKDSIQPMPSPTTFEEQHLESVVA